MNITIHFSTNENDNVELARRVSFVYADAVIQHLHNLSCSKLQKLNLIDFVILEAQKRLNNL